MNRETAVSDVLRRRTPGFPHTLRELLRTANSKTVRLILAAVLIVWAPAALLSALRGTEYLKSFLFDFAAQSRFLIVIPLLILAEQPLIAWLDSIAGHFLEAHLINENDDQCFMAAMRSFHRLSSSRMSRLVIIFLVYALAIAALPYIETGSLLAWCYYAGESGRPSFAGYWYMLVGLPLVCFLLSRWIWRQILWARLLHRISRLNLQLVPSHPDLAGGISFVGYCLWGYLPFGFVMGTLGAGGVANRVVHRHQPLTSFEFLPLFVIAIVLIVCVGPLVVFFDTLLKARRKGIFQYGALATTMGLQFEKKWLVADRNNKVADEALEVPDFSATADLYSLTANIYRLNLFPWDIRGLSRLVLSALVPGIPVLFAAIPFDTILENLIKLVL